VYGNGKTGKKAKVQQKRALGANKIKLSALNGDVE
jgi:hypothetical protein